MPDPAGHERTDNRTQAVCKYANFDTSNPAKKPCANCPQGKGHLEFNRQRCPYESSWVEEKLAAGNSITNTKSLPSSSKGKRHEGSTLVNDGKEHENPSEHLYQKMTSMSLGKREKTDISIEEHLKNKRLKPFEELQATENCHIPGMIMDNSMGICIEPTDRSLFYSDPTPMGIENDRRVSSLRVAVPGFEIDIQKDRVRPSQLKIYNKLDPREMELMTTEMDIEEDGH